MWWVCCWIGQMSFSWRKQKRQNTRYVLCLGLSQDVLQESQASMIIVEVWSCKGIPLVIRESLYKLLHRYIIYGIWWDIMRQLSGVIWYTRWLCCHSDRPAQAGKLDCEESFWVPQGEIQSPVPGEEFLSGTSTGWGLTVLKAAQWRWTLGS